MNNQVQLLEELCNACNEMNFEKVSKILNDPLSKTIINLPWVNSSK